MTCTQFAVGSKGSVDVEYSKGGRPVVLVPNSVLQNSGLCTFSTAIVQPEPKGQLAEASGALRRPVVSGVVLFILFVLGLVFSEVGL